VINGTNFSELGKKWVRQYGPLLGVKLKLGQIQSPDGVVRRKSSSLKQF
jgi:hypothetical protein